MALDGEDVLSRLRGVPVSTWNYRSQDRTIRHLGPMAQDFAADGPAAIIYTDIARDGMLSGVNVEATAALARAVPGIPVIASGGVASAQDIVALRAAGAGIAGAILGRALYDGRVDPAEALRLAAA